jgi:hypothetical protein
MERIAQAEGNGEENCLKCSQKIFLIRSTRLISEEVACRMKSNDLNQLGHPDLNKDMLLKLGNRVKTLRLQAGHAHYEKVAYENDISRVTWRRCELGGNIKFSSLLKILQALNISVAEFFSAGFD